MGWRDVAVITPLVIIQSGQPNTGLFVYSGAPAAGNPPVAWLVAPGVTQDPFGNNLMTVTVANAIFGAGVQGTGQVIIDSAGEVLLSGADGSNVIQLQPASQRELFYSDPAGVGALIASIALANGTDSFGNTYLAGFASQSGGITAQLFAAALRFVNQASAPNSPPTAYSTLAAAAGAELNLSSGKGTVGATAVTLTLFDSLLGSAAQGVLAALNNTPVPNTAALWEVQGQSASDALWVPNADVSSAPFAAPTGCQTWQSMNTRGYQNSWADFGGNPAGRWRLVACPPNIVQVQGSLSTGTTADGTVILNLPAAYHPATNQGNFSGRLIVPTNAAIQGRLNVLSNGNVTCTGISTLGAGVEVVIPGGSMYSLD